MTAGPQYFEGYRAGVAQAGGQLYPLVGGGYMLALPALIYPTGITFTEPGNQQAPAGFAAVKGRATNHPLGWPAPPIAGRM